MILDSKGQPMTPAEPTGRTVEVARSFSFKLGLPNYSSADFFCSQKTSCDASIVDEISLDLDEWCKDQVRASILEFETARARKESARSGKAA